MAGRDSALTARRRVLVQISLWSFSGKLSTESNKHTSGCLPACSQEQQKAKQRMPGAQRRAEGAADRRPGEQNFTEL